MKILPLVSLGLFVAVLGGVAYAQAPPPITSSGLNTQISAPVNLPGGVVQHNITGGTRPGGGANLFHSFGEFGVPTNNIANFLNDAALPTTNILSRVTGGNPSNIFGTIQTQGFGNANLFLMNPAGIVFGPNASLNVGGAAHFTTADYLRLADGVQFTAMPSAQDALLSIAPVAAFGFLGNNPGTISVDGSTLSVSEGQTLSLVGGDITIGGGLSARGGKIAIASVASPGEVLADTYDIAPNVNGESFTTMGNISLLEGTTVDVSADAAGTVIIRGGQLMMTNATISADTVENDGAPVAVDIQLTGDLTMTDTQGSSAITARTTGPGNAGEVQLSSENFIVTSSSLDSPFAIIDTHTSGSGAAGNVNVTTRETIHATGENAGDMYLIDSGTIGEKGGQGGDVTIAAKQLQLTDANINTGDIIAQNLGTYTTGSGGKLTITGDTVQLTDSFVGTDGREGKAGDINITVRDIQLKDFSNISSQEFGGGGTVHITANSLLMDSSGIDGGTVDGRGIGIPWDGVTITTDRIELRNGSTIQAATVGDGAAGNIQITATDRMIMSDDPTTSGTKTRPSGVFAVSFGDAGLGDHGPAGAITIETGQLEMSGGARIDSTTQSSGRGGNVTITTTNGVSLSGARPAFPFEDQTTNLGSSRPSGIFSRTVGSAPDTCTGLCGDAGNISITTGFLNVTDGAAINSGTTSTGKGGTINVNASDNISISGMIDDGTPGGVFSSTTSTEAGAGVGGTISLTSGQNFTLSDGATVSASSDGPGNAGNIHITAQDTIMIDKATVTTEAAKASGGNIKLTANDTIQLVDSTIESTVKGDAETVAGDIELDPDFIILQNSHILAKAVDGQGGNITLIANKGVLVDAQSTLEVTSERGVSGTVTIESPIQVLSGTIVPLPSTPVNVATLYAARCVAGEGGHFSTFVDSKADSVAPTPGTFLASPFLPQVNSFPAGVLGHAGTPSGVSGKDQTSPIQLAAYSPPVLFAPGYGSTSACP